MRTPLNLASLAADGLAEPGDDGTWSLTEPAPSATARTRTTRAAERPERGGPIERDPIAVNRPTRSRGAASHTGGPVERDQRRAKQAHPNRHAITPG